MKYLSNLRTRLRANLINNKKGQGATEYILLLVVVVGLVLAFKKPIMDAMNKMRTHRIGCLPVVKGKDLVGIITEMDFLRITSRLLERMEK